MRIRITFDGWDPHDRMLFHLAGFSALAHLGALIVFSILPRFIAPGSPAMRATVAELIPASALGPPPGRAASPPSGPTASQRAAAAEEALRRDKTPPAPKPASKAAPKAAPPKTERIRRPDTTTPPLPGDRAESRPQPAAAPPEPAAEPVAEPAEAPGTTPGGISFGAGSPGVAGGIPSIGSSSFPYDYYRAILVTLLQSHWRRPVTPEGLTAAISCRVAFSIQKNGLVQEARVVESSGNPSLDQSALRAVYDSSPLPPLPVQYGHGSVGAEVVFELTPD